MARRHEGGNFPISHPKPLMALPFNASKNYLLYIQAILQHWLNRFFDKKIYIIWIMLSNRKKLQVCDRFTVVIKNWRERMSTGTEDHKISVYQDKKRVDATINQEEKIDGREWRILECWYKKNVQDQCINSVRVLIKASYQAVLYCLLLDHFLSSFNFPSEQALKLGFDLMAPFLDTSVENLFYFWFSNYNFSLPLSLPLSSFFHVKCMWFCKEL